MRRNTVDPRRTSPLGAALRRFAFAASPAMFLILGWLAAGLLVGPLAAANIEPAGARASRDEAIGRIPFSELTDDVQAKLKSVVTSASIYRRLPVKSIECDADLYLFMIRYPEVVVNIWELMGMTNIKVTRTGPYAFHATDGVGAHGDIDLVYGNQNVHVFYVTADYSGALFKRKVSGRGVLVLASEYTRTDDGRSQVTSQMDMFLQIDNVGAELLAKTLQPVIGRAADHNFVETAAFLSRVSLAAETNGFGVQQLSARLTSVAPEVRTQFAHVAARVSRAADPAWIGLAEADGTPPPLEPPARLSSSPALELIPASQPLGPAAAERLGDRHAGEPPRGGDIAAGAPAPDESAAADSTTAAESRFPASAVPLRSKGILLKR